MCMNPVCERGGRLEGGHSSNPVINSPLAKALDPISIDTVHESRPYSLTNKG